MFQDNLLQMRKMKGFTQEEIAEKVGVTRQAVAKWEAGETVPDLDKCKMLAEVFEVSLDDLANYEEERVEQNRHQHNVNSSLLIGELKNDDEIKVRKK